MFINQIRNKTLSNTIIDQNQLAQLFNELKIE